MKNRHAVALGKLGGPKGGRARALALSPERRKAIAKEAAAVRWGLLPELMRPLFWSYHFEALRLPDDEDLVMLHALAYGSPEQRAWLRRRFGDDGIRTWITRKRGKGLTLSQVAPWVASSTARRWQASNPGALIWENR
jgi:hypothetical protein